MMLKKNAKIVAEPALTKEQEQLVAKILEQSNPQKRVDKIVAEELAKAQEQLIAQILEQADPQKRVDKIVAEELAKVS